MDNKVPEKKARLLTALDKGMVMIHLDARRPGVLVPASLREESHLRLNLSYRFEPPDLTVGEWGVRCSLSFSGSRFKVAVPWSALFAVTSHVTKESWAYPDDMPIELLQQSMVTTKVPESVTETAPATPAPVPARPRAVLREVAPPPPVEPAESAEPVAPVESVAPAEPVAPVEPLPPPPAAPAAAESPPEGPRDEPPEPRRGHLRLIK